MVTMVRHLCRKCKYEVIHFMGHGAFFENEYEETLEDARKGVLGPELKKFLEEYPNGAIDVEGSIGRCMNCGEYQTVQNLSMYLPPEGVDPNEDLYSERMLIPDLSKEVQPHLPCFDRDELQRNFRFHANYPHKCKKCGGDLMLLDDSTVLVCPKCRIKMSKEVYASPNNS